MTLEELIKEVMEQLESGELQSMDEMSKKLHMIFPADQFYHEYLDEFNNVIDLSEKMQEPEEMARVVLFLAAIIDCNKHQIDYFKAKEALGIEDMVKKYAENRE